MFRRGIALCNFGSQLYGLPVISRITGGIPDVIQSGKNGYLTTSRDHYVFASLIENYLKNIEEFKTTVQYNFEVANRLYTKESVRNQVLGIYHNIYNANVS